MSENYKEVKYHKPITYEDGEWKTEFFVTDKKLWVGRDYVEFLDSYLQERQSPGVESGLLVDDMAKDVWIILKRELDIQPEGPDGENI